MTTPCLFNAGTSYLTYGLTTPINYAPTDTSVFSVSLTTPGCKYCSDYPLQEIIAYSFGTS